MVLPEGIGVTEDTGDVQNAPSVAAAEGASDSAAPQDAGVKLVPGLGSLGADEQPAFGSASQGAPEQAKPAALITGATGGLGQEFARQLACDGEYDLLLCGRNEEKLAKLAGELQEQGAQAAWLVADFAEAGSVERLIARIPETAQIELLINNAGFGYDSAFVESDLARQQALVQTNCQALMELCHAIAPYMVARGHGSILNVASVAGFLPGPYMSTYYASKAFVQSFSAALHVELAEAGVHVTALCPGPVATAFWDNADAGHTALAHMCVSADKVVRAGLRALSRNATYCAPGIMAKAIVLCGRLLPRTSSRVVVSLQKPK